MRWDYENNLPVEGTYQHREYDKVRLKSYLEEHLPFPELHSAFESVDWNLEDLFLKKAYVEQDGCAFNYSILLDWKEDLDDYWADLVNGYWNIDIPDGYKWGGIPQIIDDADVYRRLFFCETEEDIWDTVIDLPQNSFCELMKCYLGISNSIFGLPIYLTDPPKAQNMVEYISKNDKTKWQQTAKEIYSNYMKNLLKKGSILGTTAHYEHQGQIVELTPDRISVQLDSPITLIFNREIPDKYKGKAAYAVEIDGDYYATESGFETAMDLMIGLSEEEEILLDQPYRLADVIKEYRERVIEETSLFEKTKLLTDIQEKYFPELRETLITEDMIDEFYKYLTEVEGIEDIYAL